MYSYASYLVYIALVIECVLVFNKLLGQLTLIEIVASQQNFVNLQILRNKMRE
jgi:hypothetical protein